jgi:hypothetical protein
MLTKISTLIMFLVLLSGCASANYDRALINWKAAQRNHVADYLLPFQPPGSPAIGDAEYKQAKAEYDRENNIRLKPIVAAAVIGGLAFGNMPTRGVVRTNTVKTGDGSYTTTYSSMVYK